MDEANDESEAGVQKVVNKASASAVKAVEEIEDPEEAGKQMTKEKGPPTTANPPNLILLR